MTAKRSRARLADIACLRVDGHASPCRLPLSAVVCRPTPPDFTLSLPFLLRNSLSNISAFRSWIAADAACASRAGSTPAPRRYAATSSVRCDARSNRAATSRTRTLQVAAGIRDRWVRHDSGAPRRAPRTASAGTDSAGSIWAAPGVYQRLHAYGISYGLLPRRNGEGVGRLRSVKSFRAGVFPRRCFIPPPSRHKATNISLLTEFSGSAATGCSICASQLKLIFRQPSSQPINHAQQIVANSPLIDQNLDAQRTSKATASHQRRPN